MQKGHKRPSQKYDYIELEKEYMTSIISLRKLSEKHGIPFATLYCHAKKHNWEDKRIKRQQKRKSEIIIREEKNQDDAWLDLQAKIRNALAAEWDKLLASDAPHLSAVASLTKATKDAREMGVFGITLQGQKTEKELAILEQQITAADSLTDTEIKINGGGDYGA